MVLSYHTKIAINFLSEINTINSGGCGFAAVYIFDALLNDGFAPKIRYCYRDTNSVYPDNERFLKDKEGSLLSCSHVVVELDGDIHIDAKGVRYDIDKEYPFHHYVTREQLISAIYLEDWWNLAFNREIYIPKMKRFFGYGLK